MKSLRENQSGLLLLIVVAVVIAIAGYVLISNFLATDEGQEIQNTATEVIDTIN